MIAQEKRTPQKFTSPVVAGQVGYQLHVSEATADPEWDDFLARTPGGHHVQTALWAQLKAGLGWQPARVIARRNDMIVGGAQMLIRRIGRFGAIGHVPKGPLVAADEPTLPPRIISELHSLGKTRQVRYLHVQPPNNGASMVPYLQRQGYHESITRSMLSATVLIDLRQDSEAILAQMRKKTRYGVRRSKKDGIIVREGAEQDLPVFHRLLVATSERQGFSPFAEEYFRDMWHLFHPPGYLKLLISEYDGEAVSAQLVMAFGDTAAAKQFGWSGEHGVHRPNEALDWATILWAKAQGCRYYDLEGIDPEAARAVLAGEPLPDAFAQTPTSYKLGFGGQVTRFPEAYEYIDNPLLRRSYQTIFPRIAGNPLVKGALNGFRTH